ncbi:hypothetical protein C4900_09750 [Acidiferrobacter thiooxydans]|uniref:Uncharacterized protein n=1 Tax=Acidiferrobacter thiooxydans TaxID=163359 RepID=A0A368HCH8_9GAMM|nr:hypothetical protein C4900_09750 [Acidiferrobacter thiooxydans]
MTDRDQGIERDYRGVTRNTPNIFRRQGFFAIMPTRMSNEGGFGARGRDRGLSRRPSARPMPVAVREALAHRCRWVACMMTFVTGSARQAARAWQPAGEGPRQGLAGGGLDRSCGDRKACPCPAWRYEVRTVARDR